MARRGSTGLLNLTIDPTTAGTQQRQVTATAPFTWATSDSLSGTYEAA